MKLEDVPNFHYVSFSEEATHKSMGSPSDASEDIWRTQVHIICIPINMR